MVLMTERIGSLHLGLHLEGYDDLRQSINSLSRARIIRRSKRWVPDATYPLSTGIELTLETARMELEYDG